MPTCRRPEFVEQAIGYFRRQTYPARELIVVYETQDDLPAGLAQDSVGDPVRLLRTSDAAIGAKRNRGIAYAAGSIIAQWDDDDWYGPERLSLQAAPIIAGTAEITALNDILFLDVTQQSFWQASPALFADMFVEDVSGGTLMFRRDHWQKSGAYPPTSLREDCDLMVAMMRGGARLSRQSGREHMVYVRHAHNTWDFVAGEHSDAGAWSKVAEPPSFTPDRDFYFSKEARAVGGRAVPPTARAAPPRRVGCIMPTADRRAFVPGAIAQFLQQNYENRELIVVDDGDDSIADLIPTCDNIRYYRLPARLSVGAKRNLACGLTEAELIMHWDDDDWRSRDWLASQVRTLTEDQAEICGLDKVLFYEPETRLGWRYVYDGNEPWVCGGTLGYTRDYWDRTRFPDRNVGEDNAFVWGGAPNRLSLNRQSDGYVALIHPYNTSPKNTAHRRWQAYPGPLIEQFLKH